MRRMALLFSAVAMAISLGCSSDSDNATGPKSTGPFTITGTIKNNKQTPIPENARAVIIWSLKTTDTVIHTLFGQGTVNSKDATFEIVLNGDPPLETLQDGNLGIGSIALITEDWTEGVLTPDAVLSFFNENNLIGAVDHHRVLFFNLKPSEFAKRYKDTGWAKEFKQQGYNAGSRSAPTENFKPASPSGLEAVIDTFENLLNFDI